MLRPIENQRGLYRDLDTGQVINDRDFFPFERKIQFGRQGVALQHLEGGEMWMLKSWLILLEPWPKDVSLNLTACFSVGQHELARVPLPRIAEPVDRSTMLEQRVAQLEAAAKLTTAFQPAEHELPLYLARHIVAARLLGPANALHQLMEMTKHCALLVTGKRKKAG